MKLFCMDIQPTGGWPHPHACWSICSIFHSCFACTVYYFLYHLVSPCISLTYLLLVACWWVGPTLALYLPSPRLHCIIWRRKAHLPLHISTFWPNTDLMDWIVHFWRLVVAWPKNLRKSALELAVFPSCNHALRNPSRKLPNWIAHFVDPTASPASQLAQTAFCTFLAASHLAF